MDPDECFQVASLWQLNLTLPPPFPTTLHALHTYARSINPLWNHTGLSLPARNEITFPFWSPLHMICQPCRRRKSAKETRQLGRQSAEERGGLYIRFSSFMISDTLIQLDNQREKPALWTVGLLTHSRSTFCTIERDTYTHTLLTKSLGWGCFQAWEPRRSLRNNKTKTQNNLPGHFIPGLAQMPGTSEGTQCPGHLN